MPELGELLLFALPFAAYALWRRLQPGIEPSARLVWLALAGVLLAAAGTAGYGLSRRMGRDVVYIPGQEMPDGSIAPARSVPRR